MKLRAYRAAFCNDCTGDSLKSQEDSARFKPGALITCLNRGQKSSCWIFGEESFSCYLPWPVIHLQLWNKERYDLILADDFQIINGLELDAVVLEKRLFALTITCV